MVALGKGLVTPAMLARLRQVGYQGLTQQVTHLKRMTPDDNPYGDDTEVWVDMGDWPAWVRSMNTAKLSEMHDLVGSVGVFRINLPVEAQVESGDEIAIDDVIYTVQDSNLENSVRVFTTLMARRIQ